MKINKLSIHRHVIRTIILASIIFSVVLGVSRALAVPANPEVTPLTTPIAQRRVYLHEINPNIKADNPAADSIEKSTIADTRGQQEQVINKANGQIWNLKDADIHAVIQTIAELTGKSFIVDPKVTGKVTLISTKPMTNEQLYQAFLSLLQVLHYTAIEHGNIVKVMPAAESNQTSPMVASNQQPGQGQQLVLRIVPVNHISAVQLVTVLRPMMPQWARVTASVDSNSLVLIDTANHMKQLLRLIRQLDDPNRSRIEVIQLKYANAHNIVTILQNLQNAARTQGNTNHAAIVADNDSNAILISGNMTNRLMLRSLIRRLDTPNAKKHGDTIVVHLKYLDSKTIAPILTHIINGGGDTVDAASTASDSAKASDAKTAAPAMMSLNSTEHSSVSIEAVTASNSLIIRAPKEELNNIRKVIATLDVRPKEVLVQAVIVKVSQSALNQLGVQWGSTNTENSSDALSTFTNGASALEILPSFGLLSGTNITSVMNFLKSHASTDVLATPSVMVLNNTEATISDGKNLGILNREYSTDTSDASDQGVPFNTFERTDVTLSLKVVPTISPDGMLRMTIEQQDDSVDATATTDPDNPAFDTSKINTQVLVKSGDILVLGGLINNTANKNNQKVPILGSIPLVGKLFSYKKHDLEKQVLMVFIRPQIVDSHKSLKAVTDQRYQYARQQQLISRENKEITTQDFPVLRDRRPQATALPLPQATQR